MGPTSDELKRQIGETRGHLESRVVEMRQLGARRAKLAGTAILIAVGVGTAVGVVAVGAFVAYRLTRPPTRSERLQRLLPGLKLGDLFRVRDTMELRSRRRVPPVRLYLGDRRVGEEAQSNGDRWVRLAISAGQAAGKAAGSQAANRIIKSMRPGGK